MTLARLAHELAARALCFAEGPMAVHGGDLKSVQGALGRSPLFRGLSAARLEKLQQAGAVISVARSVAIAAKGDPGDALFVVLEGEVEVRSSTEGGKEVRLAALGPGAIVGEMAVLDGGVRSADVAATRRTKLLRIPRSAVLQTLEQEPKALLALVAEIVRRLRNADAALEDSAVLDLGGKLAQLLLAEAGGAIALTQSELARRIGASREKTNRKLAEWRAAGWIKLDRAGIHVLKADALRALVSGRRRA